MAVIFTNLAFAVALLLTLLLSLNNFFVTAAYAPLKGITAQSVKSGNAVDLSDFLCTPADSRSVNGGSKTMLVLGTYAADFNAIEYVQRLRYYLPELQKRGVGKIGLLLNCESEAAKSLVDMVDLPCDCSENNANGVRLLVDPRGQAGRSFGVGRGWRPDDNRLSPYVKLFGMLWGLGAWATLPAVIGGYIGNPFTAQPWIQDAMAVGQKKGRWPDMALVLDDDNGNVVKNKFSELPLVGGWPRPPLELATLRLQNMLDISIKNWADLAPNNDALDAGVLTQLGGCIVFDTKAASVIFEWKDPGICAVANFEDILRKLRLE